MFNLFNIISNSIKRHIRLDAKVELHIIKRSDNRWGSAFNITDVAPDESSFFCNGFSGPGQYKNGDLIACIGWKCLEKSYLGVNDFVPTVTPILCKIYNVEYMRDPRDQFFLRIAPVSNASDLSEFGWTREQYKTALVEQSPYRDPIHILHEAGMRVNW